jgi:putative intracellular protease/amidase
VNIAILLYEGVTALDVVGPYEVLARIPGVHIEFVAESPGTIRTDTGFLEFTATAGFDECRRADVLLIPGGAEGTRRAAGSETLLDWVRDVHEQTRYTASICTGAVILGAAGLLKGRRATTHWSDSDELSGYGAVVVNRRIVESGRIITAAGVSAGIDMALALVDRLEDRELAESIQLIIEYDPEPPFNSGSPSKASDDVKRRAIEMMNASRLMQEGRTSIRSLNS